jgi:hypothetical protein
MDTVQADNRKVNRACFVVSQTPDGELMLTALRKQFGGVPIKKSPAGVVDPNAVIAAAGSNLVIQTIEEWIEYGKLAR